MDTAAAVPSEPRLWNVTRRLRDLARRDWLAYGFAAVAPFLVLWLHQVLTSSTVLHIQIRQAHTQQNMQGFLQFLVVVIPSAYLGGAGPGLVSTLVAAGIMGRFLLPHGSAFDLWRLAPILVFGVLVSALIEHRHRREGRRTANSRLAEVTLASIGDAVIATDGKGNITFMNREAERLTGWDN